MNFTQFKGRISTNKIYSNNTKVVMRYIWNIFTNCRLFVIMVNIFSNLKNGGSNGHGHGNLGFSSNTGSLIVKIIATANLQ